MTTTPDTTSLSSLIDHILVRYHEPLKVTLPEMKETSAKLVRVHGANHPELAEIESVLVEFSLNMIEHLRKEETILFPIMRQIEEAFANKQTLSSFHCGSVANPIHQMEVEHGDFEVNLRRLRTLTRDYVIPEDACKTYTGFLEKLQWLESDTLEHATLENTVLHPLAKTREAECKWE